MLLEVKNLKTYFKSDKGFIKSVNGLNFSIEKGKTLAVVGESGCGKSVTASTIMGILDDKIAKVDGEILFEGRDLLKLSKEERRKIRGRDISMIFQEPMTSLNPALKIGYQISEVFMNHFKMSKNDAKKKSLEMLERVKLPRVEKIYKSYPHQISGGQSQRVMIAMALSTRPKLLIADEPTTALDVTIQAKVLELMKELKDEFSTSIMFITHDLGVVAEMADEVVVMYAGKIVERASTEDIFKNPMHPYTKGLLEARPKLGAENEELYNIEGSVPNIINLKDSCYFHDRCDYKMPICEKEIPPTFKLCNHEVGCFLYEGLSCSEDEFLEFAKNEISLDKEKKFTPLLEKEDKKNILEVKNLIKTFGQGKNKLLALKDVSLSLKEGETLGVVGESGSGKSTLARCIANIYKDTKGQILFDGKDINKMDKKDYRDYRSRVQMIFQDPYSSLNPRQKAGDIILEGLKNLKNMSKEEMNKRLNKVISLTGLSTYHMDRFAHEFSGGQRQRIGIARALALEPELLIADEPTSALDVSIQAQIINLLKDLKMELGISMIFISHDMAVVENIADKIAVMYKGEIVEYAATKEIFKNPLHPYTKGLLSAVPINYPGQKRKVYLDEKSKEEYEKYYRVDSSNEDLKNLKTELVEIKKDHMVRIKK